MFLNLCKTWLYLVVAGSWVFSLQVIFAASLEDRFLEIKAQATNLAGKPRDIPQRAKILFSIYEDSQGNHLFPLVALHGALWANDFFHISGPIAKLISYRYLLNAEERLKRYDMLEQFAHALKETNRQVFIDTYTNYYFTKEFLDHPDAKQLVGSELYQTLSQIHRARQSKITLTPGEKRSAFINSLLWEQEQTVSKRVKEAADRLDCPILKSLVLKPLVRFQYFKFYQFFFFKDFSNKQERISKAIKAFDIGASVGWQKVIESTAEYGGLPGLPNELPNPFCSENLLP